MSYSLKNKEIKEKEEYYKIIKNTNNEFLKSIRFIYKIIEKNNEKALIGEEEIFGRRTTLIDYFNNELTSVKKDLKNSDEEEKEEYELLVEKINEIITELKHSQNMQEPVYLAIHPMDENFHIMKDEIQLEEFKMLYEDIESEKESKEESEEEEEV